MIVYDEMWFIIVIISLLNHEFSTYMQCDPQTGQTLLCYVGYYSMKHTTPYV